MSNDIDTGVSHEPDTTTFVQQGRVVGKFWYDEEQKIFRFKGDVEGSAQIFMQLILRLLNEDDRS